MVLKSDSKSLIVLEIVHYHPQQSLEVYVVEGW
jgi:hypothetical protein